MWNMRAMIGCFRRRATRRNCYLKFARADRRTVASGSTAEAVGVGKSIGSKGASRNPMGRPRAAFWGLASGRWTPLTQAVRPAKIAIVRLIPEGVISTYVTGFCTLLARYFPGCASRSISMRLRTEFAKGSNFRNLDLFGSGYAGLGYILSLVGNPEGKIGSYLLPGLMPDTSILPGTSCKRRVLTQMLQMQNTGSFHQNGARPPTAPRRT